AVLPAPDWEHAWRHDEGLGINAELAAAREALGSRPVMIVHPDLPLLEAADVDALAAAADASGAALAPDRHGSGTNAVALVAGRSLRLQFGTGSFHAHRAQGIARAGIVERIGFALDFDTPADLDHPRARDFFCDGT